MAANKNEKQIMDVSKPGKTPPDASAKPVIVGHRPMVQDTMVNTDTSLEAENAEPKNDQVVVSSGKKVISPITEIEEPKTSEESVVEPQEATVNVAETTEPINENTAETETQETAPSESDDAAVVDAVVDQVADKQKEEKLNEEDRKRQETFEKLVSEKKYFVPIGKAHRKSKKIFIIASTLLVMVFLGLVAAIDAEMLDAGIDLPFNLL